MAEPLSHYPAAKNPGLALTPKEPEEVELRGSSRRSPHIGSTRVSVHSEWLVNLTKPFALVLLWSDYPIGPQSACHERLGRVACTKRPNWPSHPSPRRRIQCELTADVVSQMSPTWRSVTRRCHCAGETWPANASRPGTGGFGHKGSCLKKAKRAPRSRRWPRRCFRPVSSTTPA